jgi:hypothetical protein
VLNRALAKYVPAEPIAVLAALTTTAFWCSVHRFLINVCKNTASPCALVPPPTLLTRKKQHEMPGRTSRDSAKRAVLLAFACAAGQVNGTYNSSNATGFAQDQVLTDPFPYYFPQLNASAAKLFTMPLCYGVKIEEATIDQLQCYLGNGSLSSVQLLDCYLQRVHQTDDYIK